MKLIINDETREFEDSLSIERLLEHLDLSGKPVAVELNLELVSKPEHGDTFLKEGDRLEIVSLTGGG